MAQGILPSFNVMHDEIRFYLIRSILTDTIYLLAQSLDYVLDAEITSSTPHCRQMEVHVIRFPLVVVASLVYDEVACCKMNDILGIFNSP